MEDKKKEKQKSGKEDKNQGGGNLGAELIMLGLEIFRIFPKGPEFESVLKTAAGKLGLETPTKWIWTLAF